MVTRLLATLGGFAVLLALSGLHGVTAYAVAQRTNEIGVRVALGAQRAQVHWLILRQVVAVAFVGLPIGVPIVLVAGPVVASMFFGVSPHDAVTVTLAAVAMLAVALCAGWFPARRATRMSVVSALRQE